MLMKYLIYQLHTVDGSRGTAKPVLEAMLKQSTATYRQEYGARRLTMSRREQLYQQNEYRLYHKILLKYRIMAVRSKIAFMAMMKK